MTRTEVLQEIRRWHEPASGRYLESENPASGEVRVLAIAWRRARHVPQPLAGVRDAPATRRVR